MSIEDKKPDKTELDEKNEKHGDSFAFKVNGIEMFSPQKDLSAGEILKLAKEKGAIPGKPEDYILQGEKDKYENDDLVDLEQDNQSITIPNRPTPVA